MTFECPHMTTQYIHNKYTNTEEQQCHRNTHTHTQTNRSRVWEQPCLLPLHHYTKPKGICRCVNGSEGRGGAHTKGIPSPGGRSGAFFPLEPHEIEVGFILVHTHTNVHSHRSAIQTQSPAVQCVSSSMQGQKMGRKMGSKKSGGGEKSK